MFLGYLRKILVCPVKIPAFTICIGNATVGGAGKTQVAEWLAKSLLSNGCKVLIITKGYGSRLKGAKKVEKFDRAIDVGDESKLLSEYCDVVAAKSVKLALPIIKNLQPDIVIFDDGMQNPAFHKDLNILVIDALNAVGNNKIFPSGPLREKFDSILDKSDIIVAVGNSPLADFNIVQKIVASVKPYFSAKITLVESLPKEHKYFAFAGIGNTERFFSLLRENGLNLVATKSFPDHYIYYSQDIESLKYEASSLGGKLITTKKDLVKLENISDILAVKVQLSIEEENKLLKLIDEKITAYT